MGVEVRRLAPGDEALVHEVSAASARFDVAPATETAHPPLSREAATRLLADDRTHLLVAEARAEVIGFALVHELLRRHGPERMAMLYEIGVREDRRRTGVGRALLAQVAAICRRRGLGCAFVLTDRSNHPAMALYAACGWNRSDGDDVMFELRI